MSGISTIQARAEVIPKLEDKRVVQMEGEGGSESSGSGASVQTVITTKPSATHNQMEDIPAAEVDSQDGVLLYAEEGEEDL